MLFTKRLCIHSTDKMEDKLIIFWTGSILILVIIIVVVLFFIVNQNKILRLTLSLKQQEMEREEQARKMLREGEDKERRRLAAELHDGLGARLSYLKMKIESESTSVENLTHELDLAIEELREMSHNLHPDYLNRVGLLKAIGSLIKVMNKHGKVQYHYHADNLHNLSIGSQASVHIMRMINEIVNNIHKHSEAKDAYIQFTQAESCLYITVEDNGKGFLPKEQGELGGIGLNSIQERVHLLDGKLTLVADKGTLISIEIPMSALIN